MKFHLAILLFLPLTASAADTNALPALAPAYGELPPTFWQQHETAIVVGGFALLAFVVLILKVMLRPKSNVILPPEVLARDALMKLLRQPEDGKLLSEASQILRRYVSAAFALPAGELTTTEFCAALAASEKAGAELAQSVSDFLRECDERKFSPANPSAPFNAANRALELVARAEAHRARLATATGPQR